MNIMLIYTNCQTVAGILFVMFNEVNTMYMVLDKRKFQSILFYFFQEHLFLVVLTIYAFSMNKSVSPLPFFTKNSTIFNASAAILTLQSF